MFDVYNIKLVSHRWLKISSSETRLDYRRRFCTGRTCVCCMITKILHCWQRQAGIKIGQGLLETVAASSLYRHKFQSRKKCCFQLGTSSVMTHCFGILTNISRYRSASGSRGRLNCWSKLQLLYYLPDLTLSHSFNLIVSYFVG